MVKKIYKEIKVGVVGCGRISPNHFDAIKKCQNIKLTSICDTNAITLAKYKKKLNVNGYSSIENMLKNENLDLVSLCTPSGLHAFQTELCAKNGVNVLTEKPMATNWEDGLRMIKVCKDNLVKLFVVKQNRNNPTLKILKRAISEKRFGKINMVNINVFWNRPQKYYDQAKWRGTLKLDGGALMNQASHYIDLLVWLIGPIEKVHAIMSTKLKIEVEDTGVLNIKWKNGTLGSMNVTMLTYDKNFEGSITILGEKGTVRIGGVATNKIQHWEFDKKKKYDKNIFHNNYDINSVYGFGHKLYYKNVIKTLHGKADAETDGNEGLKSLEIITAAYLSSRYDKPISLPLRK